MSNFSEEKIERSGDGKFAPKATAETEIDLGDAAPLPSRMTRKDHGHPTIKSVEVNDQGNYARAEHDMYKPARGAKGDAERAYLVSQYGAEAGSLANDGKIITGAHIDQDADAASAAAQAGGDLAADNEAGTYYQGLEEFQGKYAQTAAALRNERLAKSAHGDRDQFLRDWSMDQRDADWTVDDAVERYRTPKLERSGWNGI